jgi:hypothetical protein
MPGITIKRHGRPTYPVVEAVAGGQLVEGRAGGVGVAAAGSKKFLGVAIDDAVPPGGVITETTIAGQSSLVGIPQPTEVVLATNGDEVPVQYAANATNGQALIAAAAGKVTPAPDGSDPAIIVGRCIEPDGVVIATSTTGLMRVGY